jgi:hypothetical protein
MHQKRRPVLDESASAHIDLWPDLGTIYTDPDIYFEVSALLEGGRKCYHHLERDLKPGEGVEPE